MKAGSAIKASIGNLNDTFALEMVDDVISISSLRVFLFSRFFSIRFTSSLLSKLYSVFEFAWSSLPGILDS